MHQYRWEVREEQALHFWREGKIALGKRGIIAVGGGGLGRVLRLEEKEEDVIVAVGGRREEYRVEPGS